MANQPGARRRRSIGRPNANITGTPVVGLPGPARTVVDVKHAVAIVLEAADPSVTPQKGEGRTYISAHAKVDSIAGEMK
jgi:hypothetical protein